MALYKVTRTDEIKPGEFVEAFVIAGGTAQARQMVSHLSGTPKDPKAYAVEKIDVGKADMLISAYFNERNDV